MSRFGTNIQYKYQYWAGKKILKCNNVLLSFRTQHPTLLTREVTTYSSGQDSDPVNEFDDDGGWFDSCQSN